MAPVSCSNMIHVEFGKIPNSWWAGLQTDLRRVQEVTPGAFPPAWCDCFTAMVEVWQAGTFPWKRMVQAAARTHLLQERIASEARQAHRDFFATIQFYGGSTDPGWKQMDQGDLHVPCECGAAFTTF